MLYTSHWRSPLLADLDAQLVSISRGEPRRRLPFSYRRLRGLAPDAEAWAQEGREAFTASYLRQLEGLGAERILERLEEIGDGRQAIALLCWERLDKPGEWCHRRLLADYIERETGTTIPELKAGDLPQRPDAPQPRLF